MQIIKRCNKVKYLTLYRRNSQFEGLWNLALYFKDKPRYSKHRFLFVINLAVIDL